MVVFLINQDTGNINLMLIHVILQGNGYCEERKVGIYFFFEDVVIIFTSFEPCYSLCKHYFFSLAPYLPNLQ